MDKSELYNQLFDTILKAAIKEDFQKELNEIPTEKELQKKYTPSQELKLKIKKIAKKGHHKIIIRKAMIMAKKAAVIIAIMIPVALGSLLSVEASRNVIVNSVLEWKADHVDIYFHADYSNQLDMNKNSLYQPQYLTDGFAESETVKFGSTQRTKYQNKENVSIAFDQTPLNKEGKIMVDSEHTTYKGITINGQNASLFEAKTSNDKTSILFQRNKISFMLCSTVDKQELIKIAESIKIKE